MCGQKKAAVLLWTPPSFGTWAVHTTVEQSAGGTPVTPASRSTSASTLQERWCSCCTTRIHRTTTLRCSTARVSCTRLLSFIYLKLFFFYLQCFYTPKCRKDYAVTHAIIQNISERLRSQHTVQCFVDPTERSDCVILTQIYGRVAVFHSLFWPTCTLIGGTVIIAMVKLTQYLSIMCERISHIKKWPKGQLTQLSGAKTERGLRWGGKLGFKDRDNVKAATKRTVIFS